MDVWVGMDILFSYLSSRCVAVRFSITLQDPKHENEIVILKLLDPQDAITAYIFGEYGLG